MQNGKGVLANNRFRQPAQISLQSNGGYQTLNITLVGQQYPDYLILELSRQYRWQDVLPQLKANKTFAFTTVAASGEQVTGTVDLLSMTQFPQKLLFVSYPREANIQPLRTSPRIPVNCGAELQLHHAQGNGNPLSGTVVDVSGKGIGFQYRGTQPVSLEGEDGLQASVTVTEPGNDLSLGLFHVKSLDIVGPGAWQFGLAFKNRPDEFQNLLGKLLMASSEVKALLSDNDIGFETLDNTLQAES